MLLQGVVWGEHRPHLRARQTIDSPSSLVSVGGLRLSYRLSNRPSRTCIGHRPFRHDGYVDCDNPPEPDARVCRRCAIVEATFASNLHHSHTRGSAELDPAINEHLDQPNRLYLAAFRDGSIKIGTSTLGRATTRLEEQGAWMARFVAETVDGRVVRHLEDAVTERLGISQSVSATRKRRGLVTPLTDDRLASLLDTSAAQVVDQVVVAMSRADVTPLDEAWRHPTADHPAVRHVIDYPLRLDHGRHDLEAITAIGRHLLARRSGGTDVFVVDPTPLFGIWLDVGDYGSDEIAIQDSLF